MKRILVVGLTAVFISSLAFAHAIALGTIKRGRILRKYGVHAMKKSHFLSAVCACLFVASLNVNAALIGFDGIVTDVTQPAGVPNPGLFSIGDLLNGNYTFDASTLNTNSFSRLGVYIYRDADVSFSLGGEIGSSPLASSAYGDNTHAFNFTNPIARDLFQWFARQEEGLTLSGLGDWYLVDFDITLEDFSNSAVPPGSPGNFLVDPVDISLFPSNRFVLSFCAGNCLVDQFEVRGEITSFNVVPTPTTAWLFGTGLLGLLSISRRNKSA